MYIPYTCFNKPPKLVPNIFILKYTRTALLPQSQKIVIEMLVICFK